MSPFPVILLYLMTGLVLTDEREYLLGQFEPASDSRFIQLRPEHSAGSARGGFLRKETYEAFIRMADAAKADGIQLVIISATRNFEGQKKIWEDKWFGRTRVEGKNLTSIKDAASRAKVILRYSSMPGSSRHHWGTEMDLNSLENSYFESGKGLKAYQWLLLHATTYGFCQPYTSKTSGRTGYEEEKWHWSFSPLSGPLLQSYVQSIRNEDLAGFAGSETAVSLRIVEDFVQGVSCK